jgi:hypothetical protein
MATTPPRVRFRIVLEDAGGNSPAVVRLRLFLKTALRSWGLRCREAEAILTAPPPLGPPTTPPPGVTP